MADGLTDAHFAWVHQFTGVNMSTAKGGASAATAPASYAPDGLIRQKGTGGQKWDPAPAGASKPAASADWVHDQLVYYGLGPADTPDPAGQSCIFNGDATTIDAVAKDMAAQADLSGWTLSDSPTKQAIDAILKDRNAAVAQGRKDADQGLTDKDVASLAKLPMQKLLDTLQGLRQAGKIEAVWDQAKDDRLKAAILAVEQRLNSDWEAAMKKLSEPDAVALRDYVVRRMDEGDIRAAPPADTARASMTVTDRILFDIDAKKELDPKDLKELNGKPMAEIMPFTDALQKSGQLEALADIVNVDTYPRLGVALATEARQFDADWSDAVAAMNEADREILLARPKAGEVHRERAPQKPDEKDTKVQGVINEQQVYAYHWIVKTLKAANPATDATSQMQLGINWVGHGDNKPGVEISGFYQFGYNATTGQISHGAGGQAAFVTSFFNGLLQAQLVGSAQCNAVLDGKTVQGQVQVQVAGQLAVNLSDSVSVGVIVGGTGSIPLNDPKGSDFAPSIGLGVQGTFDMTPKKK
jgi:hypothetical protein